VFKGTAWIEFPTVLVLRASDWASHLEGGDAAVLPLLEKVGSKREEKRAAPEDEGDEEGGKAADTTQDKSDAEVAKDKDEDQTVQPAPKKPRVEPAPTLGLAALGAYVSDGDGSGSESGAEDDVDPSAEPIEWDSDGGFDFTHHPEVAVALHRALAADFGDEEQGDGEANQ
jgi:hypothetical protein